MLERRKRVLVVDEWSGWQGAVPVLDLTKQGGEVVVVKTASDASPFFNGVADAEVLIVGSAPGVADFVRNVRGRFDRLHIIGLAEYRSELANLGCNCFVARDALPHVVKSRLHY